ncbi:peptidoglycan-binding domain-containing protein [Acidovorax soli]|uniref:Putative peptidoglycan binding domain-containing protein n=1 Tax=Acidovorax soli TaxID=592050 RepID=A0A1H4F0G8_9BURK|nr:peptidoglycan-binding domain-containing protein [Acidovorax soli]SEA90679.1 Putative peptidoglycan binding domain-containing protein [Acidovorax soli]
MTGEEEQKKGEGKGFAGLSSLVSDVDTTLLLSAKTEPAAAAPGAGRPAPQSQPAQPQPQPQPSQHQTYQEPAQPPSSGSSGGKWILGIAAVIGLLWLIGQSNKNTTSPAPAYSPPAQSTAPSYTPPPQPQAPSRPVETKPPVGQDLVLSREQIRYCLAEDIRIDGAKSALNNYTDVDVDRFNAMVADYNSRCSSFKYQTNNRGRNDLNSSQRDIEPFRSQLQSEGRSRFDRSPSTGSLSVPEPSRPAPDATVQAIQRKLIELGYDAGTADGLMGRGTRSAVIAFQQDRGLAATGEADQALLLQLQRSPSRPNATLTTPSASSSPAALATAPAPQPPPQSNGVPDFSRASASEQASIESVCGVHKRVSGPADYYRCQQTELTKLSNSGGQPDLSRASASEQASIESVCGVHKRVSGPADYYRCQQTELTKLSNSGGQPDLSRASASEQASIESVCGVHKRVSGPADYYRCQQTELTKLSNSGGQPDLSRASASEQASIESVCGVHKRVSGPADYYRCQQTELTKLSNSGGQPDLSRASASERASIESVCGVHKRVSGPADYYNCLRGELNKLTYR